MVAGVRKQVNRSTSCIGLHWQRKALITSLKSKRHEAITQAEMAKGGEGFWWATGRWSLLTMLVAVSGIVTFGLRFLENVLLASG